MSPRPRVPTTASVSGSAAFLAAARTLEPVDGSHRAEWTESARADFLASLRHQRGPGDLDKAHGVDESVSIARLVDATALYAQLYATFAG